MSEEMKIDTIIAIDPGANGGIVAERNGDIPQCYKMPKDISELRDLFEYYKSISDKPLVFLEKLSVRPDDISVQGGNANMGKLYRIQKMIANYEHLKSILEVVGLPYVLVHPISWMCKLGVRKIGVKEEKAERKRRYKEIAGQMFPGVDITLWNADALLILRFGKNQLSDSKGLNWIKSNLPQREISKLF